MLGRKLNQDVRAMKPEAPVALHLSGGAPELRRAFGTLLASRLASAGLAPVVLEALTWLVAATTLASGASYVWVTVRRR